MSNPGVSVDPAQQHLGLASRPPQTESTVLLRRAAPDDAEVFFAIRGEPSASRYQPLRPLTVADLRARLATQAALRVDGDLSGEVQWLVDADGQPAGWVTLKDVVREHGLAAIGYTISERWRGRGVATAAVAALLPIAFETVDLIRLEAVAAVDNHASRRVLERNGFCCEGIARALLLIAGHRVDHARYALLRSEWRAHSAA